MGSMDVLFYGMWGAVVCPALWSSERKIVRYVDADLPPEILERIDGGFCPGAYMLNGELTLPPVADRHEGLARIFYITGWTIVALWDRSVDPREGSHAIFLLRGHWEDKFAIKRAEKFFPDVWRRLPELIPVSCI